MNEKNVKKNVYLFIFTYVAGYREEILQQRLESGESVFCPCV